MTAQSGFRYVAADGSLTLDGIKLFRDLESRVSAAEAKFAAIALIAAPSGGATTDAEARAAIAAIIAGAA